MALPYFQVQRTPLVARTNGGGFVPASVQQQTTKDWAHHHRTAQAQPPINHSRNVSHRQPFGLFAGAGDRSYTSANLSDRSGSANEVENMLVQQPKIATNNGWQVPNNNPPSNRSGHENSFPFLTQYAYGLPAVFAPAPNTSVQRSSRGFRPAIMR